MYIICQKCGYEWDYNGSSQVRTTCPKCQRKTRIVEIDGDPCD